MPRVEIPEKIREICKEMEQFEASASVAKTGTGARREGRDFEGLIAKLWLAFRRFVEDRGAQVTVVAGAGTRKYAKLSVGTRSLFVPTSTSDGVTNPNAEQSRWLEVVFRVNELIAAFPTEAEAVRKYAPQSGPYAGKRYPQIFSGLSTKFDDTVVLVDGGVLREKGVYDVPCG